MQVAEPADAEKKPATQFRHRPRASASAYCPAGQSPQEEAPRIEVWPRGHWVQVGFPVVLAKKPGWQGAQ